jgi:hypothetical protein
MLVIEEDGTMARYAVFIGFLVSLALAGCAASSEAYPGTDVMEVPGFELETARDLEMVGSQLRSGELVYTGTEDVREAFREYMSAMVSRGWTRTRSHVTRQRATGTLFKDNRAANVEFVKLKKDETKATITVSSTLGN